MKKNILFYFLGLIAITFASCDPLDDTIAELPASTLKKDLVLTVTNNYKTTDEAKTEIAKTLNKNYPQLGEKSTANVTYNSTQSLPAQIKPADSLLSSVPPTDGAPTLYTVTDADYLLINSPQTFKTFTSAKVLQFLETKYNATTNPAVKPNQLIVLNYFYFESGATTSAGVQVTDTFLYLNGVWTKVYQVSQAQYISVGKLTIFNFGSNDEANLNSYFNTFLKNDVAVSSKAKPGDVKYISYAYFASSKTYQRIRVLVYNGTNWEYKQVPTTTTLGFLKKNGTWIADPTVYYTLVKSDYEDIKKTTIGSQDARDNLAQFVTFDVSVGQKNSWTDAQIIEALIFILNKKYPAAPVDPTVYYNVTYGVFKGPAPTATKAFVKTSTGFVYEPNPQ